MKERQRAERVERVGRMSRPLDWTRSFKHALCDTCDGFDREFYLKGRESTWIWEFDTEVDVRRILRQSANQHGVGLTTVRQAGTY